MYSYFTRKQANIIYKAFKQGRISVSKSFLNGVYNLVNKQDRFLSTDDRVFRGHCERAIEFLLDNKDILAQYELEGYIVAKKYVVVDTIERESNEDDWFADPGEILTEEIKEPRYVIYKNNEIVEDNYGPLVFFENGDRDVDVTYELPISHI